MYLTFSDYTGLGGNRTRTEFDRMNMRAQQLLDVLTHKRVATEVPVRSAMKYAAFELVQAMIADADSGSDAREIASMSNDGVSVSYATTGRTPRARYTDIARFYLGAERDGNGTPLLYMGVDA